MRKPKKIAHKANPALAVVVDGKTEVWYLQMLKRNERGIRVNIKPEIPNKKSIEEQYNLVRSLSDKEYTKVFWIVDLDTIIKENDETPKGKIPPLSFFEKCRIYLNKNYPNVVVIINNPCLEFWFLLHFKKTSKYYTTCSEAEKELKKYLKNYEKSQKFFTKQNDDIYLKLRANLNTALDNATALNNFDIESPQKSICQMERFFHSEELKKYFKQEVKVL